MSLGYLASSIITGAMRDDNATGAPSSNEKRRLVVFYAARHRVLVGVVIDDSCVRASDGGLSRRWATTCLYNAWGTRPGGTVRPDREWGLGPGAAIIAARRCPRVLFEDAAPRTAPVFRCPAAHAGDRQRRRAALVATAGAL